MSVLYVLTTPIPDEENATVEQIRKISEWENDNYAKYMAEDASSKKFLVSDFTNYKMTDSRPVMDQYNELLELSIVELDSHLRIEESIRLHDSNKPNGNNVVGPSVVNMVEHNNSIRYKDNKGKRKHKDIKTDPNKKSKLTCWKCEKSRHLKKDYKRHTFCRMMMLRGGLTQEQLFMCVKIDVASRFMSY
nr:hypothetical protein [Tanacetum cinerariifolium]